MGYTSKYAQDQMNKAVSSKQDKPKKKKNKKHVVTKGENKITRKEAKEAKNVRGSGHAIQGMSTRKVRKSGRKVAKY